MIALQFIDITKGASGYLLAPSTWKKNMTKMTPIMISLSAALALSACGGGGGSAPSEGIIAPAPVETVKYDQFIGSSNQDLFVTTLTDGDSDVTYFKENTLGPNGSSIIAIIHQDGKEITLSKGDNYQSLSIDGYLLEYSSEVATEKSVLVTSPTGEQTTYYIDELGEVINDELEEATKSSVQLKSTFDLSSCDDSTILDSECLDQTIKAYALEVLNTYVAAPFSNVLKNMDKMVSLFEKSEAFLIELKESIDSDSIDNTFNSAQEYIADTQEELLQQSKDITLGLNNLVIDVKEKDVDSSYIGLGNSDEIQLDFAQVVSEINATPTPTPTSTPAPTPTPTVTPAPAGEPLSAPNNFSATVVSKNGVELIWEEVENAGRYFVYYSQTGTPDITAEPYAAVGGGSATTFTDSGLADGTYSWIVVAVLDTGEGINDYVVGLPSTIETIVIDTAEDSSGQTCNAFDEYSSASWQQVGCLNGDGNQVGLWTQYRQDKSIESTANYVDGVLHGEFNSAQDGEGSIQVWVDGKIEGIVKSYNNGLLVVTKTYVSSIENGPYWEERYGRVIIGQYVNGKRDGQWVTTGATYETICMWSGGYQGACNTTTF